MTKVDARWLSLFGGGLTSRSKPLKAPPPFYEADSDSVKGFVKVRFGPHGWELPNEAFPLPTNKKKKGDENRTYLRHFARLLMEGSVFSNLKPFRPFFTFKPTAINGIVIPPKAVKLLQPLQRRNIKSRKNLLDIWCFSLFFAVSAAAIFDTPLTLQAS